MKVTAWGKFSAWFVCLSARESQAGQQPHSKSWLWTKTERIFFF